MNYSEFIRQLGVDPASQDSAFLRARNSAPEFIRAAAESDRFENCLSRAIELTTPADLLSSLKAIGRHGVSRLNSWRNFALAASVLVTVAVLFTTWHVNTGFESVEHYVADHYSHDGAMLVARGSGQLADNVDEILDRFQLKLTPQTRRMVGLIKFCPTPAGEGVHMVLNTELGPITVIFMPDTVVTDGEILDFDGMQAQLVPLLVGSAAVIGTYDQRVASFYALVQNAFVPLTANA